MQTTSSMFSASFSASDTPIIQVDGVSKRFGTDVLAVDNLSLTVQAGQFLALLGPSGCGKSTTLRLLAGLESPDSGSISLGGRCVASPNTWVAPDARRVGMVFQDYALFPHLTVAENITFPLPRLASRERRARVTELTELVGLAGLDKRYPHQLSGGQQQRVALARALAAQPTVVLLDEPFSNLDALLRESTRAEVQAILTQAEATTILVTHDQEEALSLADTVAVMLDGALAQIGSPAEIYLRPATPTVATFVGTAYFINGEADGETVDCVLGRLPLTYPARGRVKILLRPDAVTLQPTPTGRAHLLQRRFFGPYQTVTVRLSDGTLLESRLAPHVELPLDTPCDVHVVGSVMGYAR